METSLGKRPREEGPLTDEDFDFLKKAEATTEAVVETPMVPTAMFGLQTSPKEDDASSPDSDSSSSSSSAELPSASTAAPKRGRPRSNVEKSKSPARKGRKPKVSSETEKQALERDLYYQNNAIPISEFDENWVRVSEPSDISAFNLQGLQNVDVLTTTKGTKGKEEPRYLPGEGPYTVDTNGRKLFWEKLNGTSAREIFIEEEEVFNWYIGVLSSLVFGNQSLQIAYTNGDYDGFHSLVNDEVVSKRYHYQTAKAILRNDKANFKVSCRTNTNPSLHGGILFNRIYILKDFIGVLLPRYEEEKKKKGQVKDDILDDEEKDPYDFKLVRDQDGDPITDKKRHTFLDACNSLIKSVIRTSYTDENFQTKIRAKKLSGIGDLVSRQVRINQGKYVPRDNELYDIQVEEALKQGVIEKFYFRKKVVKKEKPIDTSGYKPLVKELTDEQKKLLREKFEQILEERIPYGKEVISLHELIAIWVNGICDEVAEGELKAKVPFEMSVNSVSRDTYVKKVLSNLRDINFKDEFLLQFNRKEDFESDEKVLDKATKTFTDKYINWSQTKQYDWRIKGNAIYILDPLYDGVRTYTYSAIGSMRNDKVKGVNFFTTRCCTRCGTAF